MPVRYVRGDLFASGADVLVIPVNCVGVAGKGLALQCKQRYPEWFASYKEACTVRLLVPGYLSLYMLGDCCLVSFPTKDHWRYPSRLDYIEQGLQVFVSNGGRWHFPENTVAFPQLGCGAGGLSWSQVQPVMEHYLSQLPCTTLIYV